jgi:signal peptidase II
MAVFFVKRPAYWVGLSILLGGALANWVQRIVWVGVVDYWHISGYPYVFNLADVAIKVGIAIILVQAWRSSRQVPSRTRG